MNTFGNQLNKKSFGNSGELKEGKGRPFFPSNSIIFNSRSAEEGVVCCVMMRIEWVAAGGGGGCVKMGGDDGWTGVEEDDDYDCIPTQHSTLLPPFHPPVDSTDTLFGGDEQLKKVC
jgi:hypothetical protein